MSKKGPILIIDDDKDDREILGEVFKRLGYKNEIIYFSDGLDALHYLESNENTFLILTDVNMPRMNGLELREKIMKNDALRMQSIPFLFFTTATTKKAVLEAYYLSVQGFFIKPTSFKDLEAVISKIMDYWQLCKRPSEF